MLIRSMVQLATVGYIYGYVARNALSQIKESISLKNYKQLIVRFFNHII